jgi:hypothetical protein
VVAVFEKRTIGIFLIRDSLIYQCHGFVLTPPVQVATGSGFYYFLKGRDRIIRKWMFKGLPQ